MANEQMRETWTDGGAGWVANQRVFDAIFAPLTEALLDAADLGPGRRVLDVGCGSGTLLEGAVRRGAGVTGIDLSEPMVAAARRRVPQATVLLADAQTTDLRPTAPEPGFDRVISRFGVMFFSDPVAAFANLRAATAPGATATLVCWRDGDNPMFTLGTSVLTDRMDSPPASRDPSAPGPRAFGDPDRVRSILGEAGWGSIEIEPLDTVCDHGFDGADGVEERLAVILASTTGLAARNQLEPRLGPDGWADLLDQVREEIRRHLGDGPLTFPARCWLVSAVNPDLFQIGEVADRVGLSLRTVRYYEEMGLLTPTTRSDGGFRLFSQSQVDRLMLIKRMKPLGVSLDEMRQVLEARDVLSEGASSKSTPEAERQLLEFTRAAEARCEELESQLRGARELAKQLRAEIEDGGG